MLYSKIDNGFTAREKITDSTTLSQKYFKELKIGMYELQGASTEFFPYKWGTLIHFKASDNYGCMIVIHTHGTLYIRHYSIYNNDWYTDWKEYLSKDFLAI